MWSNKSAVQLNKLILAGGGCEENGYFLLKMSNLYSSEEEYRYLRLTADEIRKRRNDVYTNGIVEDLWKEMFDLLTLLAS